MIILFPTPLRPVTKSEGYFRDITFFSNLSIFHTASNIRFANLVQHVLKYIHKYQHKYSLFVRRCLKSLIQKNSQTFISFLNQLSVHCIFTLLRNTLKCKSNFLQSKGNVSLFSHFPAKTNIAVTTKKQTSVLNLLINIHFFFFFFFTIWLHDLPLTI